MHPRNVLVINEYNFHSLSPRVSFVALLTGVIGGWSPASTPFFGFVNPSSNNSDAILPHSGCVLCYTRISLNSKLGENVVDSDLGYVMNPLKYRCSATCIVSWALIPKVLEATFSILTVFSPIGLATFTFVLYTSVTSPISIFYILDIIILATVLSYNFPLSHLSA